SVPITLAMHSRRTDIVMTAPRLAALVLSPREGQAPTGPGHNHHNNESHKDFQRISGAGGGTFFCARESVVQPGHRAACTAASTRAFASASEACTMAPEAKRWPPPPNYSAILATSTVARERKLTFTPPAGCSMKKRPTSTPPTLRV